jgi:hypothetical protein
MFDGHNLSSRLFNCFIDYTEASTYEESAESSYEEVQLDAYCQAPPASGMHRQDRLRPLRLPHSQID